MYLMDLIRKHKGDLSCLLESGEVWFSFDGSLYKMGRDGKHWVYSSETDAKYGRTNHTYPDFLEGYPVIGMTYGLGRKIIGPELKVVINVSNVRIRG